MNEFKTPDVKDFRLLLQRELVKRCKSNERYSLRSFAQYLNVDSSRLSKMLRGQRPINSQYVEKIGKRLGLSPMTIEEFKKKIRKIP